MNRMQKLAAILALGAIAVAAIGSTASATTRENRTIVQTAAASGQFTTLTRLLKQAGLVSTLQRSGPYTVFAPTDAAFEKVPKKSLQALLGNEAKLKAVLLSHVLLGKVTAGKIVKLSTATTANGERVRIHVKNSSVYVNNARVTQADVMASNGVIHVVNRVLIPPQA